MYIVSLDIETISQPESAIRALITEFNPDDVKLGTSTKPETVAAKIAEARLTHGDDIVAKAALYPEYAQIAISGFYDGETVIQHSLDQQSEEDLIDSTWSRVMDALSDIGVVVGFNIKAFDLPFLVKRSWIHGVPVPKTIYNPMRPKYPWNDRIVDLMEVYTNGVYGAKTGGLNQVLKVLGLPTKTANGKEFAAMWSKQSKADALEYNKNDVKVEYMLARRILGN